MGQLNWARSESEKGTCMEGPEWHGQCMELQPPPTNQTQLLLCDSRVSSPIWQWMLDPETNSAEVSRRVLHQNVTCCAQHQQECTHLQQHPVCWNTKSEWQNCSQENETSRSLPETPRTASQQTGAVGTNASAPVKRTPHTNICGRTQDGHRSTEHQRAGRMYGEQGWLEATMEGSSEDDLEREHINILIGFYTNDYTIFPPNYINFN